MKIQKKKLVSLLVLAIFLASIPSLSLAGPERTIKVWIKDHYVMSDVQPYLSDNRTYVPIRFIAEELGYKVGWEAQSQTISIKSPDTDLVFKLGSKEVLLNGYMKKLDQPALLKESRTFIPLRNIGELLGIRVDYDKVHQVAHIGKDYDGEKSYPLNYYHKNDRPIRPDFQINLHDHSLVASGKNHQTWKNEKDLLKAIDLELRKLIGPSPDDRITFKDPILEITVREALNNKKGPILRSDVEKINKLDVLYPRTVRVKDLSGLENLVNLEYFNAWRQDIEDISPLKNLTKLKYINLGGNRVKDISPLIQLTNLEHLELDRNKIVDLSPLKNQKKLKHLDLNFNNDVKDFSPIKHLDHLEPFFIQFNLEKRS